MLQYFICTLAFCKKSCVRQWAHAPVSQNTVSTNLQHITIEGSTLEHKLQVGLKNAISLLAHLFNCVLGLAFYNWTFCKSGFLKSAIWNGFFFFFLSKALVKVVKKCLLKKQRI